MASVTHAIRALDELLRGDRTRSADLRVGLANIPLRIFIPVAIVLGCTYGLFMGWYAIAAPALPNVPGRTAADPWLQLIASTVKLPALFVFTLIVTFPSLYVFNALVGARLRFIPTLRLLIAAVVINLAVGASLGPILGFFTVSTSSYAFMIVLNAALLGIAGMVGLWFLLQTLRRLTQVAVLDSADEAAAEAGAPPIEGEARAEKVTTANTIFSIWVIIYALVGAQMGWLLRPFIGHPNLPFEWIRGTREGNFFSSVAFHLRQLLGM
ncbi:MAG: hypothetical protein WD749_06820 [Phycisphaerales bacterium]